MTDLRERCISLTEKMCAEINGDLFYVPDEDVENLLSKLTEDNLEETAGKLAHLAAWFN